MDQESTVGVGMSRRRFFGGAEAIATGLALSTAAAAAPTAKGSNRLRLTLPAPTGPYSIGTVALHLIDHARQDPWLSTPRSRELMVSLWYPARHDGRHAPAPNYASVVTNPDPRLRSLSTNGLQVTTMRTVFYSSESEQIICPRCAATTRLLSDRGQPNENWEKVSEAIGTWHSGDGDDLACPGCGRSAGLNEWRWTPPWAFGHFGLTFWNWPPLTDDFVTALSHHLGHRTVRPYGKL